MQELLALMGMALLVAEFWQRRRQAEAAERHIRRYCQQHGYQYLSMARGDGLPLVLLGCLLRRPQGFWFEFSDDGEASREGECFLTGLGSPIFRIAPPPSASAHHALILPFPDRRQHKP